MTKVDLLTFLATGALGPLRLDLDRDTIVQLLGAPDGTLLSSRTIETIRYGNLQLQLRHGHIGLISLDFAPEPPGSKQVFEYDPWHPTSPLSKNEFERIANQNQISLSIDVPTNYGSHVTMCVAQSGTHVTFSEDHLESIYVSTPTPRS